MKIIKELIEGVLKGDHTLISKSISLVENYAGTKKAKTLIQQLYPHTGTAHIVGITGPPGCGKSTLIGALTEHIAQLGHKVAVLAIDASSPYSGGSILGNRIRMQEALYQYDIFMRSMATRGFIGGLSRAVWDATMILDAAGQEFIIIETVGAGQSDFEIMNIADTTVVVLAPGLGDEIQAIKAGIMEIGDIFVINKFDLDGALLAMRDIQNTLSLLPQKKWKKPVISTVAIQKKGINTLFEEIVKHKNFGTDEQAHDRAWRLLRFAVEEEIREMIYNIIKEDNFAELVQSISAKKIDPYTAAKQVLKNKLLL